MAYSGGIKEHVLQLLKQGKGTKEVFLEINKEYKVGYGTIQKWKSEAGLTKPRNKSKAEKQQAEVVEELEPKETPSEIKEEQVAPEVIKREKQEKRQTIINRWKMAKFNGSDEEKVAVLKEWVELEPKNIDLKKLLVSYLTKLGRDKEAQQYEVPELENEKEAKSQGWRPVKIDGSVEEKVATLENLLKSEPKNLTSINQMTSLMISLGRIEQAEEYQRRAEEINANDNYVLGNKIRICCKKRDFEQAERVCKEAMQQYKIGSFFIVQLANIYQMQGKYKEAEEVLLQYKSRFVGNYEISRDLKLAEIYIQAMEYEKAEQLLQAVKMRDKDNKYMSKISCDLSWLEMNRGNFDKAKASLEVQGPLDDRIKLQQARLLLITGEYDKARQVLATVKVQKEKATILLARIEAMQGDNKKAIELVDTIVLNNKDYETMIIQRISFACATLKLVQIEPGNERLKKQLISIYKMAQDNNDILLQQLIQREYGAITEEMYLDSPNGERQKKADQSQGTNIEDLDKVIQEAKETIRVEPENIEARKKLVQAAMQSGEVEYAEKMCYEILDLKTDEMFSYKVLLHIAKQRGNEQEARDIISVMTEIYLTDDTADFDFDMNLDWSIPRLDKEEVAQKVDKRQEETRKSSDKAEDVVKGLQISKEQLNKLIFQSKTLQTEGKLEEARKLIEEQLKVTPNNEQLLKRMYQIANEQRKWDDVVKYAQRRLEVNPNSLGTLKFLCIHAKKKDQLRKYQRMAKKIIEREGIQLDDKEIKVFGLQNNADMKILPKQLRFSPRAFVIPNNNTKNDLISKYRTQIKQGNLSVERAGEVLAELENDHSIRAIALKAEIYLIVFSNPKGAKKLVEERSRLEGTTSKEKNSLAKISEIIRRAEKGIAPRELETIR